MKPQEFRAAAALAAVFSVRLLGLFMIYPVFAAYAATLAGANPYLIGEALGIYGLTQGLLQIPFGLLSDRIGRKIMIVIGLVLFGIGSAVAAVSASIGGVIIGRALQGAGAVGSVILALVADLTGEDSRTAAMAMVGITIGASFLVALLAGPIVANFIGVGGIFWLMVALAAQVARGRLKRGVKLNYPESIAIITDFVMEGARSGRSVPELMSGSGKVLRREQVMEGIPEMIHEMQVEATFPDNTKLISIHDPIR